MHWILTSVEYQKAATPLSGHENALFLSTRRTRMGVQAIENMVKKYAQTGDTEQKNNTA